MKRISGLLSKQLNQMLNKEVDNTSFLEDELSSITSLKISKRDLPYLDYFENVEDLIIEAFPSITSEDILFIGEKLTKIKSLKIKEQNALFDIDLSSFNNLENLCLIHNDNLSSVIGINNLKRFTFYNNKDYSNLQQIVDYLIDFDNTTVTLDITYYIPVIKMLYERKLGLAILEKVIWVETIGLRKYSTYEYTNKEIESLMKHVSHIASRYVYVNDSEIEKFAILYNWAINNLRFVNEDDSEGENLSLISNVNKVFSYSNGGRLTLAKAFQMLLSFVGIDSSVVYSMGATDVIGYYNGEKVCSLLGESDYAVLRVSLDGKNYYCDIAWDAFINFHGFFDKLRFFLFSKNELKLRHKFVGEGNIESSHSYHGDDCDELLSFAKKRVKEVDELFDDIERLKPDISGKELNVAITKLKINDLKNEIDDLDMNSSLYKDKMLDLTKLEDEIDSLTADIVRFENEREGIINSYSNLLIRRYLNDDVNIDLSKLEEILIKKIKTMEISEYLTSLLELCLKNKTA